jgi:hypothetical protein
MTGVADLMEEIARIYGYDRIPETRLADELPPQRSNPALEQEEAHARPAGQPWGCRKWSPTADHPGARSAPPACPATPR